MTKEEFEAAFRKLITNACASARGNNDFEAAITAHLAKALGYAVAIFCEGIPQAVNMAMEGFSDMAFEEAVRVSRLARPAVR